MEALTISNRSVSWEDLSYLISSPGSLKISPQAKRLIKISNDALQAILKKGQLIYGVNTGFGKLSSVSIDQNDIKQLQLNLVRSHAAGIGSPFNIGIVRVVMALKILTWSKGYSGVRPKLVNQLIAMLNKDIIPLIPSLGSVGASGDLAPLSHLACAMIGEGDVVYNGKTLHSKKALYSEKLKPVDLNAKEGLSLINGTQVSTALGVKALLEARNLLYSADIISALSVESSLSTRQVFNPSIHKLKKHRGQNISAKNIYNLLIGSDIVNSHKDCDKVQDPYCMRCIPHIHGTSWEVFLNTEKTINNEINSISDNPMIFPNGSIHNSGHFHAEPVAQSLDSLSIAISEIGAISERRIHYIMKGADGNLPMFGAVNSGLESGYMIAHVTAASLASENKTLAHPSSIDSITTSGGQEDIVSMAPWAGRSCLKIIENVRRILAIELLVSGNVNHRFHQKLSSSKSLRALILLLKQVRVLSMKDRVFSKDIEKVEDLLKKNKVFSTVNKIKKVSRI
tara:strand:- start:1923 stop:3455 length:1533 start_codon:yes stop_codon:yes gene_type:complete